ncbi:KAP family P-loop NTPase fold protein [Saccharopolyspora tripterygii]
MAIDVDGWNIEPGAELRRTELHAQYGGNRQSGIAPIADSPNILIFTGGGGGQYGYTYDGWHEDGTYHYTGEGQTGDQTFARGNNALATPGRKVRLFRDGSKKAYVEYVGEFRLANEEPWYYGESEGSDGQRRRVIVFRLEPLDPSIVEPPVISDDERPKVRGDVDAAVASDFNADPAPEADDEQPSQAPVSAHDKWSSDRPATKDELKRDGLARVIAGRIRNFSKDDADSSFLIHIDGPWGTGKSTILELLKQKISDDYLVVEFDAWKHASVTPSWWALLAQLRTEISNDRGSLWRRVCFRLSEVRKRALRGSTPYIATGLFIGSLAVAAWAAWSYLFGSKPVGPIVSNVKTWISMAGVVGAVALVVSRFVWWDSARGAKRLEQVHKNPMDEVSWYFSWLLESSPKRVVFFLDDLDRCSDRHVVDLLDSVQTLVRDSPNHGGKAAYFVVAAHGNWLRRAYETAHGSFKGAVDEPGRGLGHLFINKLFQLTVPMPTLSAGTKQTFLNSVLEVEEINASRTGSSEEGDKLSSEIRYSESEEEVVAAWSAASPEARELNKQQAVERLESAEVSKIREHSLQKFGHLLDSNPRSLKRFTNTYGVLRSVRTIEGSDVGSDLLAFWLVLQTRWPILTEYLEANLNSMGDGSEPIRLDTLPPEFQTLVEDPELHFVLRNAPEGVKLTPDAIRACCGAQAVPDEEKKEESASAK